MITLGPHTAYPALKTALPPLIRRQRTLEAKVAPALPFMEPEKAVRKLIVALLIKAKVGKGESVTCLGYDVTRCERAGNESLNPETIVALLVQGGVDREFIEQVLKDSTETADDAQWATVKPSKGATVKAPAR